MYQPTNIGGGVNERNCNGVGAKGGRPDVATVLLLLDEPEESVHEHAGEYKGSAQPDLSDVLLNGGLGVEMGDVRQAALRGFLAVEERGVD